MSSSSSGSATHSTGYGQATAAPPAPQEGELELVTYPAGQETGAVDLPGEPFEGKAVLVFRGESSFHDKAIAAQRDGAAAVIIANNVAGTINASVEGADAISVPVVTITRDGGTALQAAIAQASDEAPAILTWTDEVAVAEDPVGGKMSDFSSWGVAADLSLKPDVLAPGGDVFLGLSARRGGRQRLRFHLDGWHFDGRTARRRKRGSAACREPRAQSQACEHCCRTTPIL